MRALFLIAAVAIAAALNFLVWWGAYRPVTVELLTAEPPRSISFAPFHRGQSPLVQVYPSPAEIERARKIVHAFEAAERDGLASIQVDGYFIDYPIVEKALRVLSLASRIRG